jgi:hypothetical protein
MPQSQEFTFGLDQLTVATNVLAYRQVGGSPSLVASMQK